MEIQIYREDCRVRMHGGPRQGPRRWTSRGIITSFSPRSRRSLRFVAKNADAEWEYIFTLTYPRDFPKDGQTGRRNREALLQAIRREYYKPKHIWVTQFQARGAPHLHILTEVLIDEAWLLKTWSRIIGSQELDRLVRVTHADNRDAAVRYIAKLHREDGQAIVPEGYENVGRLWGCSRGLVKPKRTEVFPVTKETCPMVRPLRKRLEMNLNPRPVSTTRDGRSRRKVQRHPQLTYLHGGISGFTVFGGALLAEQLLQAYLGEPRYLGSEATSTAESRTEEGGKRAIGTEFKVELGGSTDEAVTSTESFNCELDAGAHPFRWGKNCQDEIQKSLRPGVLTDLPATTEPPVAGILLPLAV